VIKSTVMKKLFFILIALFNSFFVTAQPKPVIKNLVFEGGGVRGIAYCGAINELEKRQLMQQVEKVGGTSAGAIVALTVALGYTSDEISRIIAETNFKQFNDGKYFFAGGINRTNKYFGWYRGKQFENWLEKIIRDKTGDADISFTQLHDKGYKDLYVTGTCLNKQQLVIFSRNTYPAMKIKDAVRISMSIPLYFEAVFIDADGKVVHHPKNKEGLDIMVDGGFTGNFPIRLFDTADQPDMSTLGFRIDRDEQIKNDRSDKTIASMPVTNFRQYIGAFYNMTIENLNRQQLSQADWQRTISISDGDIGPKIRKLSAEEKNLLIENGRKAAGSYFN
jgi:NTE family protein